MLRTQRSFYLALTLTGALIIGFLHLDSRLSSGATNALPTEGVAVLGLAVLSMLTWAVSYRSYRNEIRRRDRRRRQHSVRRHAADQATPLDILRAA